jgi:translation elongation factor EF-G
MTDYLFTVDIAPDAKKNRRKLIGALSLLSQETGLFAVSARWFSRRVTLKAASEDALLSALDRMRHDRDLGFTLGKPEVIYKYRMEAGSEIPLEPVMALKITASKMLRGPVKQDIHERHGTVVDSNNHGEGITIEARVPLHFLFGYRKELEILSHGKAIYTMESLGFFPVQPENDGEPTPFAPAMAMRARRGYR